VISKVICTAIPSLPKQVGGVSKYLLSFVIFKCNLFIFIIPDWTKEFASQPEIFEYIKDVAKKFDVYKYAKFRHQVKKLTWNETLLKWEVRVVNLDSNVEKELLFDIV